MSSDSPETQRHLWPTPIKTPALSAAAKQMKKQFIYMYILLYIYIYVNIVSLTNHMSGTEFLNGI